MNDPLSTFYNLSAINILTFAGKIATLWKFPYIIVLCVSSEKLQTHSAVRNFVMLVLIFDIFNQCTLYNSCLIIVKPILKFPQLKGLQSCEYPKVKAWSHLLGIEPRPPKLLRTGRNSRFFRSSNIISSYLCKFFRYGNLL